MKSLKLVIASVLAFAAIGVSAQTAQPTAPSKFSGDIGYTSIDWTGGGYTLKPSIVRGTLGYEVSPNLAVEGMIGMGANSSNIQVGSYTVTSKIDSIYGLYLKPKAQVSPELEVYGRLGVTSLTGTFAVQGYTGSYTATESSASYGLGVNYKIAPGAALNLDYTTYYTKNGATANGITAGVAFRF